MTRIGFAYNQKPEPESADAAEELSRADEEPPSSGTRNGAATATLLAPAPAPDDEYAEWDSAETIDAVARALARHGEVIRLEARDDFPERLRAAQPDIVFNIAEGLRGPNREAHVPAICEFYGIPYSGSDPFTLALCLDKARTKEILRANGVPTADWTPAAGPIRCSRSRCTRGRPRESRSATSPPTRTRCARSSATSSSATISQCWSRRSSPAPSSPAACSGTDRGRGCFPSSE
jgi:hypothetical protein